MSTKFPFFVFDFFLFFFQKKLLKKPKFGAHGMISNFFFRNKIAFYGFGVDQIMIFLLIGVALSQNDCDGNIVRDKLQPLHGCPQGIISSHFSLQPPGRI